MDRARTQACETSAGRDGEDAWQALNNDDICKGRNDNDDTHNLKVVRGDDDRDGRQRGEALLISTERT